MNGNFIMPTDLHNLMKAMLGENHNTVQAIFDDQRIYKNYPPMNVGQKGDNLVLKFALPDFKKEDIQIHISGNTLTVKGTVSEEKEEGIEYHVIKIAKRDFEKSFMTENPIKEIDANWKNGTLVLEIIEEDTKRIIDIKGE